MFKILKVMLGLILLIIILLAGLIGFGTLTRYRPADQELLFEARQHTVVPDTVTIRVISWNIGYAGLGDDMDFFYDGGKKMRTTPERTQENHQAIMHFLTQNSFMDFFFLQEVDVNSHRSYGINTLDSLKQHLPFHSHVLGLNYVSRFVPVPPTNPMGRVNSGIVTSSRAIPISAHRISFPGSYPWPGSLFNLNRCFLINRYLLSNGRELIIINTHNSAFDDGELRKLQMKYLRNTLQQEYEKGNYIIAGGDWNQCPPAFKPEFYFNHFDTLELMHLPTEYLEGWQWVYDPKVPTNRRLQTPYHPNTTLTTLIDFFLVSPNVEVLDIEGIHLDFKHSDHNPVQASFRLKNP